MMHTLLAAIEFAVYLAHASITSVRGPLMHMYIWTPLHCFEVWPCCSAQAF